MRTIKRYANRKLYDTATKRYLKLEHVADLVRGGEPVRVIDNSTGRDITNVTLSQAILGRERQRAAFLTRGLLTGLLTRGRNSVYEVVKRALTSWVSGAHGLAGDVEGYVRHLVEDRHLTREEGRRLGRHLARTLRDNRRQVETWLAERTGEAIARLGLPTQADVERLAERIDRIATRVDQLSATDRPPRRGRRAGRARRHG